LLDECVWNGNILEEEVEIEIEVEIKTILALGKSFLQHI